MKNRLKPTIVLFLAWATYVLSITNRMIWTPIIPLASADIADYCCSSWTLYDYFLCRLCPNSIMG